MKAAKISVSDAMAAVTLDVDVTGVCVAGFRLWLGMKLIKVAALIIGCGIEFKSNGS